MIVKTKCSCGHINHTEILLEWIKAGTILLICEKCDCIYTHKCSLDEETFSEQEEQYSQEEMTTLNVDDKVVIDNKDSTIHGQEGIIVDKDFIHYKVQLPDTIIWLPYLWVNLKKSEKEITNTIIINTTVMNISVFMVFIFALIGFIICCKTLWNLLF